MSEENVQIARQQIDAFNRRDVEGVVEKVLEPWESIRVRAEELAETSDGRVLARLFLTGAAEKR